MRQGDSPRDDGVREASNCHILELTFDVTVTFDVRRYRASGKPGHVDHRAWGGVAPTGIAG